MKKDGLLTLSLALALGASACLPGPKYVPKTLEQLKVPDKWTSALPDKTVAGDLSAWWRQLGDPLLNEFIEQAVKASPTMDLARAKVREARAERGLAKADLMPTVSAAVSVTRSKSGTSPAASDYLGYLDASWEPDISGANRLALKSSTASLAATVADLRDSQVSLVAEVAADYISVRTLQARIAIARENLTLQSETREIAGWRYQAGLVSALDYDQARTTEAQTQANIPSLETSLAKSRNALAVLIGVAPGALDEKLSAGAPIPSVPGTVITAIPAEMLRQRPDIRAAEQTLIAKTALVGEAAAARYPSLTLTGTLGVENAVLSAITDSTSVLRSLVASLAQTIFDSGRIRRQIQIQTAVQEQALATYESTVLAAVEDVEDALVSLRRNRERLGFLKTADEAARSAATYARQRYAVGLIDYTSVASTQQSQLTASESLKTCEGDITTALVQLYKAFGGGWQSSEAPAATPADR